MPRAFTSDESEQIRSRLRQAGQEAFSRRGIRGTTVEELARAAAISKGAFYRFYDSKEALLIALLDDYEVAAHARFEAAVRADPDCTVDILVDASLHALEQNPLLPVLMSQEGLRALRSCPPEQQQELLDRDLRLVRRVMSVLEEAGITPGLPETVLLGLLRSLVFIGAHRGDIGADLVEEVSRWLKHALRTSLLPGAAAPGAPAPSSEPTASPTGTAT